MNSKFDPMTGERIEENGQAEQPYFYQAPEQPSGAGPEGKKKKGWIFVIIAVIIFAAAGAMAAAVKSGVFLSDSEKVIAAITNTVNDTDYLSETLKFGSLFASGEYTVSFNSEAEEFEMELQCLSGKSQKQLLGSVDIPDFTEVDFQVALTEEQLKVQVPVVSDYIFTYNYVQPKSGYLQDNFGDGLDTFDEVLEALYSSEREIDPNTDLMKTIVEEGKKLEFEKVSAEEFEVDNKGRKCKGISTIITRECIQNILDELEIVFQESQNSAYGYNYYYIEDYFDDIEENLAEMEDFHVTFFIYKNKLACVRIEEGEEKAELRFLGGDTRMQNMQVLFDGEEMLRVEGENVESTEVKRVFVEGEETVSLEYDHKNGELDITADNGRTLLSGNVFQDKDGFRATLDRLMVDGQLINVTCDMSIKRGASFKEFEGREFDLGQATQKDMEALFQELNLL